MILPKINEIRQIIRQTFKIGGWGSHYYSLADVYIHQMPSKKLFQHYLKLVDTLYQFVAVRVAIA